MFVGRERDLDVAVSLACDGMSVDVVGTRGSGRSSFLEAVRTRLSEHGRVVIALRGVAALRRQPFGAISVSGLIDPAAMRGPSAIGEVAAALAAAAGDRAAVFVVDDADDVDDVSWGVIDSARRSTGFPLIVARSRASVAAESVATEASFVIELHPLGFEHLQRVLQDHLGGPLDIRTAARIFSKSGGVVGLALRIADIATREGKLERGADGNWMATEALWSSSLRNVVESYLEGLSPEELDAVHLLALVGVADVETARSLVDWPVIERLEETGLVQFTASGTRQFLALTPPILVDYVRNGQRTARHLRLTELIAKRVGIDDPMSIAASDESGNIIGAATNSAVFSRMLQERIRAQRLLTGARWQQRPEPVEAEVHVRLLIQSGAAHADIEHVFTHTDMAAGDEEAIIRLTALRAKWLAYARGDVDAALATLERGPGMDPDRRDALAATELGIRASLSELPADLVAQLQKAEPVGEHARFCVLEALLYVAVIEGRFADANGIFDEIAAADPLRKRHIAWALHTYSLVGQGRVAESLAITQRGMSEAHGHLDLDALRTFGSSAVLSNIFVGDFEAVDRILDILLATGESYSLPRGFQVAVLNVAAVVAIRRGDLVLGERYVTEIANLGVPDGPLPGQDASWSHADLLSATGQREQAADVLWRSADALWNRGARYSAALGIVSSLERHPTAERLAQAHDRIAVVEGDFLRAAESYASAIVEENPDEMQRAAQTLLASGRTGYAIEAFRSAQRLYEAAGRGVDAALAQDQGEALLSSHGGQAYAAVSTVAAASALSDRERQVARLAAGGMSNTDIASTLVLSIRTVESHMYRVLRKLGVESRVELAGMRSRL